MATIDIRKEDKIIYAKISGVVSEADFKDTIGPAVEKILEQDNPPDCLFLDAEGFDGWEDLSSFISHMEFIRDHHQYIKKVAVVGIDKWREMVMHIVAMISGVEAKFFPIRQREEAKSWLISGEQEKMNKVRQLK
jgi:hypothetical protein